MRILFKTSYLDDIRLFQHSGQTFWYGLLVLGLLLVPFVLGDFYVGEFSYVFILAIAGVGLMLLIGYTGLVSLGHGAFMAIGAYTNTYLITKGVPFLVAFPAAGLAALLAGSAHCGACQPHDGHLPGDRHAGLLADRRAARDPLGIGDRAASRECRCRRPRSSVMRSASPGSSTTSASPSSFWWCLAAINLTRSPTGRAMVAIRDFEISAQSLGVNLVRYKTVAFALSAGITGLAGALLGHKMRYISPDAFNILLSIQLLLMVVVGGLGSIHGAILGAIFVGGLPQAIALMRDYLPHGNRAGRLGWSPACSASSWSCRAVRAARHLWALAQDQGLLRLLPALPARDIQAAAVLSQDGAGAVTLTETRNGAAHAAAAAPRTGPATPALFEADNISIAFGGIRAVDGVTFSVAEGEIFAIVGPNGAGKSTIFNLISRIYEPTGGRLVFQGQDITSVPAYTIARRGIARTFQNIELFEHATVLDNLLIGRHCRAKPNILREMLFTRSVRREELEHREAVEEVIDFLDLANYRDQRISGLPYGVRKVVELARALVRQAQAAAARRAGLRPQHRGDRGGGVLDRRHQERPRRHGHHDRARHVAGVGRVGPRARSQQRAHAGTRHAVAGAGRPGRDRGLSRRRRRP